MKKNNRQMMAQRAMLEDKKVGNSNIVVGQENGQKNLEKIDTEIAINEEKEMEAETKNQESNNQKKLSKSVSIPLDYYNKCKILTMLPESKYSGSKVSDIVKDSLEELLFQEKYVELFKIFDKIDDKIEID